MSLVPRLEGVGVNQHNRTLDQRLGTDQFVVRRVVRHVQDTDFAGTHFGAPCKVATIQSQGTKLRIATPSTDGMNGRFANLRHGGGTAHFELALLAKLGPAAASLTTFVTSLARNALSNAESWGVS